MFAGFLFAQNTRIYRTSKISEIYNSNSNGVFSCLLKRAPERVMFAVFPSVQNCLTKPLCLLRLGSAQMFEIITLDELFFTFSQKYSLRPYILGLLALLKTFKISQLNLNGLFPCLLRNGARSRMFAASLLCPKCSREMFNVCCVLVLLKMFKIFEFPLGKEPSVYLLKHTTKILMLAAFLSIRIV